MDAFERKEAQVADAAKLAFSIAELLAIHPGGRTSLYAAIASGELIARKSGRSTLVLVRDYERYLEALPRIEPRTAPVDGNAQDCEEVA